MIVNRANVPGARVHVAERDVKGEKGSIDGFVDLENGHDVANGMSSPHAHHGRAQASVYRQPEMRGDYERSNVGGASQCQQKRAAKMARKAEKQAAKLAKAQAAM